MARLCVQEFKVSIQLGDYADMIIAMISDSLSTINNGSLNSSEDLFAPFTTNDTSNPIPGSKESLANYYNESHHHPNNDTYRIPSTYKHLLSSGAYSDDPGSRDCAHLPIDDTFNITMDFISSAIAVLGIIGNLILIFSMVGQIPFLKKMRPFLVSLACCDTLLLITNWLANVYMRFIVEGIVKINHTSWISIQPYLYVTANVCFTAHIWLTLLITLDRYLAVCHPLKHMAKSNSKSASYFSLAVTLLAVIYNTPRYRDYEIQQNRNATVQQIVLVHTTIVHNAYYWYGYHVICHVIFTSIGPVILLIYMTVKITKVVRQQHETSVRLGRQLITQASSVSMALMPKNISRTLPSTSGNNNMVATVPAVRNLRRQMSADDIGISLASPKSLHCGPTYDPREEFIYAEDAIIEEEANDVVGQIATEEVESSLIRSGLIPAKLSKCGAVTTAIDGYKRWKPRRLPTLRSVLVNQSIVIIPVITIICYILPCLRDLGLSIATLKGTGDSFYWYINSIINVFGPLDATANFYAYLLCNRRYSKHCKNRIRKLFCCK